MLLNKKYILLFLEKIISLKSKNRDKVADYLENIALISHLKKQILMKKIFKKNRWFFRLISLKFLKLPA